MAHVTAIKLSSHIYWMKAYSFSLKVAQTIFQYNEKFPSYDVLNKDMHSKRAKTKII